MQKKENKKIAVNDPRLDFIHNLLDTEEEKEIISMIYKKYPYEKIIEKLICFSEKGEEINAKI